MRIFLTGATGAIGSSLLDNFLAHGHDVTSTVRSAQKGEELASKSPSSHFIVFDINPDTAHQLAELAAGYDAIVHCVQQAFGEAGTKAEDITTDALISAARKTAETKPVSLLYSSGCLVYGNTNGVQDEDHEDTSHCLDMLKARVLRDKKIVNSTAGNLRSAIIRPTWVYGKSYVDQWINACKSHNKIIALAGNNHIPFIHHEDLANMYRILIENGAVGVFNATEPEAVSLETVIERVSTLGNIHEIEKVDSPWAHSSEPYGFFLFAHSFDQQLVSKRFADLYHYTPAHRFLDWINSFPFN
ncbi:unnamed protein product [Blepharisma stoltei]|uniref:NAD-dependent epimerase/dehydratase domain-containing protein n=1 Tax=Blepharisma stoltei TaxID=1481888 RepID=A0AAU9JT48_9CILI|nr:unnamed protein product [Blepharisma stoltei]